MILRVTPTTNNIGGKRKKAITRRNKKTSIAISDCVAKLLLAI
jgi:hypothetical protein